MSVTFDQLWKHQQAGVIAARSKTNLALFYDVGVGKTATTIYILREEYTKHQSIQNTLIFAPLSVCPQWKKEFAKFSKIDEKHIHVLTGTGVKRTVALQAIIDSKKPAIVVTNYEAIQNKALYALLLKWSPDILVCDESQRLKDSTSVRAKAIYPLAYAARRRFLLTGTPILNSMLDIFGQFKALDHSIFGSNFFEFKRRYFYDKNAYMPRHIHFPDWHPLPNAAKNLGDIIGRASVQAKKSECLDLPPLVRVTVPVQLSAQQRKTYDSMAEQFVAELEGTVVAAEFAMVKTLRLQQIIAGFLVPEELPSLPVWCKENPRLDALEELLETINGEKTIIWSVFQPTYAAIAKVCERLKLKYVFLTGEQSAGQKQESIESFCRGAAQVIIANPRCGGVGVSLTESRYSIYYTRGYSLEDHLQSEGRNFRGGSEMHEKISHFHLVAEDTLDEVIAQALLNKQNVADAVLGWAKRA